MPKGHNADGSPKKRPVNSGKKPQSEKGAKIQVAFRLAPDVVEIIRRQANQAEYLEGLVRKSNEN